MDGYEAAISLAREAQPTVRYEYEYRGVSFDQGRAPTQVAAHSSRRLTSYAF